LLAGNMAEALFAEELRNGRGVRLHMNFHCYLSDSIPILGFYAIENNLFMFGSCGGEAGPNENLVRSWFGDWRPYEGQFEFAGRLDEGAKVKASALSVKFHVSTPVFLGLSEDGRLANAGCSAAYQSNFVFVGIGFHDNW
jgi:hypothetical protein